MGILHTIEIEPGPDGHGRTALAAAPKPHDKRRNLGSGLTPEQLLVWVNAIRKGKGLPTTGKETQA
jgi:hypothetical protein